MTDSCLFCFVLFSLFWQKEKADFFRTLLSDHTRGWRGVRTNGWLDTEDLNGQCLNMQNKKKQKESELRQGGLGVKKQRNQKNEKMFCRWEGHFVCLKMEGGSVYKSSMGHM